MEQTVLIIGQYPDPHIEKVVECLVGCGVNPLVFQRHSSEDELSIDFNGDLSSLMVNGLKRNIISVWWRVKPHVQSEFSGGVGSIVEGFIVKEWTAVLRALHFFTEPGVVWINPIENHYRSSFKAYQLMLAKKVGLQIPFTLISNSPQNIKEFLIKCSNKIIYKSLSSFIMPPKFVLFTTLLEKEDILNSGDQLLVTPGIYQEYCEKTYELRVTVIGEKVFTTKIDSQHQEETKIDWRKNQFLKIYAPYELTKKTQRKLLSFHKACGLIYAAYDFIVNEKGEEVFLECNPGGQWLWIEEATGFPISHELALALVENK